MWSALDTIFKQKFSVDLFEFSDMKYIDSKLSLIEYMHCYLANMEFCFVSIKWLLFGFCSNQCLTSVVKFSKTHTMVVHFSSRTRPKRKKTENTTTLELWSLLPESNTESSIFLLAYFFFFFFFLMLHVVFHQQKLLTLLATSQNKHLYSPRTINGVSLISPLLDHLFALTSVFL